MVIQASSLPCPELERCLLMRPAVLTDSLAKSHFSVEDKLYLFHGLRGPAFSGRHARS